MFQLVNRVGSFPGKVFHRVRVAQPVGTLDCVIHVPLPVVRTHVRQACSNSALRGDRVRPRWENLCNAGRAQTLFGHPQRCTKPCAPGTNHDNVIGMIYVFISGHGSVLQAENAIFATANRPVNPTSAQKRFMTMIQTVRAPLPWI